MTGKYWIYLTDKEVFDSQTCARQLDQLGATVDAHAATRRAKSMPDRIVDFHDLPVASSYVEQLHQLGLDVVHESRWLNAVSVRATRAQLAAVAVLPFVSEIAPVLGTRRHGEPDGIIERFSPDAGRRDSEPAAPGDPFDYGPSRAQLEQINVIAAHQAGLSGAGVIVGVFDTGFEHDHPAFSQIVSEGRLLAQYDFVNDDPETQNESGDDSSQHAHGTFTWSALGGFAEGELVGPAYGASFLLAKTEDITSETPVEEDNWVAAAEWADQLGVDVISTSLSYIDWYTYEDMDGDTAPITIAADIAASRGIVVCVSAGNQGGTAWYYIGAPADADSIIAVGAVDADNILAEFSSHGPTYDGRTKPEVLALGVHTHCAIPVELGADYADVSGTSLSCPLVGGVAALVVEAHPNWPPMLVRQQLLDTADNAATPDNDRGWGLVDTYGAITAVSGTPGDPLPAAPLLVAYPNPSRHGVWLEGRLATAQGPVSVEIFDPAGRLVRRLDGAESRQSIFWDGRSDVGRAVAPGIYYARWQSGEWQASTKLILQGS
ncbi:MAG: S8 family peptidase [Candidatus Eisenbacteria bacterium]|uniref:S8 family peptidase n=1 Tax=Eiseniibacteriota bacterium TaxID=2212470 RepID=A0A956LY95_UNCEI|nr:S8 family peptidase [Candidatus Eisenbacteria bacterium]